MIRAPIETQHLGDVDDLGLAGCVLERVVPRGEHAAVSDVLGGADARELEPDLRTVQPARRLGDEEPVRDVDAGAQRLRPAACRSSPREPMASPPGTATSARPLRAPAGRARGRGPQARTRS